MTPAKPKRRYTVTPKVLAANRRNLQKANAVPKAIRYRSTPQRQAACRQNLLKAQARRPAARPACLRRAACRWLGRTLHRCGESLEAFRAHLEEVARILNPDDGEVAQAKLTRAIGEGLWRWLRLLRSQVEGERKGLRAALARPAVDPLSAAAWACRLLRLFRQGRWLASRFERLAARLERLGRLFWEDRHMPDEQLREALEQTPAEALGNPFRPLPPGEMSARLRAPLPACKFFGSNRRMPEVPAEEPLPEEEAKPEEELEAEAEEEEAAVPRSSREHGAALPALPDWPDDFDAYHQLVEEALAAPPELAPLVERIAQLSWERQQVWQRELERAEAELGRALRRCYTRMRADDCVAAALEALAGQDEALARAEALEADLAGALHDYLCRRYGPQPAFELLREPAAAASRQGGTPYPAPPGSPPPSKRVSAPRHPGRRRRDSGARARLKRRQRRPVATRLHRKR